MPRFSCVSGRTAQHSNYRASDPIPHQYMRDTLLPQA